MPRYIDADALIKKIYPMGIGDGKYTINAKAVKLAIDNAPTADVVPKRKGKWKPYKDFFTHRQVGWICTNCSSVISDLSNGDTDYCPHCGAVMETESEGE